jgi:ribosomal protein S18 acetylase RimI-like enzyme
MRGEGLGRILLKRSERAAANLGGRRLYAETSSREQYAPTRDFYDRNGYRLEALLEEYYAPLDGKCIYVKEL